MAMPPRCCPHCQEELPDRGRFCVMCGRRIEAWGAAGEAVPRAARTVDERSQHATMELPFVGHELRAAAPDHRVHTSPVGTALPPGLMGPAWAMNGRQAPRLPAALEYDAGGGVPTAPLPAEQQTDPIRITRSHPSLDLMRVALVAVLCAGVATAAGLLAYRTMMSRRQVAAPPAPPPAPERPVVEPRAAQGRHTHRTSDLVVSVAPLPRRTPERRARVPGLAPILPSTAPTTSTTLDVARPRAAEAAGPPAALSEEERRVEAEAQLAASDIEFVASTHHVQVQKCYERAFRDPAQGSPGGRVELAFVLGQDGRALDIRTVANTTYSEALARCLEQRVAEWRFPRPAGAAKTFHFPFVFLASPGAEK